MTQAAMPLKERRQVVKNALRGVGYEDAHVRFDWAVSDHEALARWRADDDPTKLPSGVPARLDVIAFCDERERNWATTAFVAEVDKLDLVSNKERGRDRARRLFELTASPTALFAGNGRADLWLKCWQGDELDLVRDIPFDEEPLRREFRKHRQDVDREALARLRGGQRYLFDAVYDACREDLVQFLHRGLSKATWLAPSLWGKGTENKAEKKELERDREALSRVAIALLAARILEDKDFFGPRNQSTDARQILHEAEHAANGFFTEAIGVDLARLGQRLAPSMVEEMLRCLIAHLTGPASFSLVTAEMLGYLYEKALVAERRRGGELELNGIHYTPRSLAQHVLDRIPLEELRPSQRCVLDVACGSGSFLLSATQRLREAFDAREPDAEDNLLDHLRNRVIGNDTDRIAVLVARLAYLLEHWIRPGESVGVPEPNRWWFKDALTLTRDDFGPAQPTVIVGNPPFSAIPGGEQLASQFLLRMLTLLAPGGFLGIVMPGAFLKMRRQKAGPARKTLLDSCELLEVWELPLRAVGLRARQETCVTIARRRGERTCGQGAALFKATYSSQTSAVADLREHLRSSWTFAASGLPGRPDRSWSEDTTCRIIASPIDSVWRRMDLDRTLSRLSVGGTGIDAPFNSSSFSARPRRGFVPYLHTQKRLSPYFLTEFDWKNDPDAEHNYVDPDTCRWPKRRLWPLYRAPKVLVRSRTNRNSAMQLAAAYDDSGVFPEHDFRCVALRRVSRENPDWANGVLAKDSERALLFWLTAVLNSPIAHAWVATCSPPRGLLEIVLNSLPLPVEYDPEIAKLVARTSKVARPKEGETPLWDARIAADSSEYMALAAEINDRVISSYGLNRRDHEAIKKFLRGMTEPWVEAEERAHLPRPGATYRRITGKLLSVDVKRQQVTLDLPRYRRKAGGPVTVPLPKHMPGWVLRGETDFTCLAPADKRDPADLQDPWLLREFRPLPFSYLEPGEIEGLAGFRALEATV